MKLQELIRRNRSFRRFQEDAAITRETLLELIELARLSATAANRQPLKFLPACSPQTRELIFPCLGWAGYLRDWIGPADGERPSGYIIILLDKCIHDRSDCDHGIAAQSILLGATEMGLGGCMIGSIRKHELQEKLSLPSHLEILLVIALGQPAETVDLEEVPSLDAIEYWRDSEDVHHVPKRSLEELIVDPPNFIEGE
jgi:nitroreductase